ncbi:MAG TPA: hypothetical protein VNT26_22225 [Candidatus Sulfotelmatobacter sp.]|nr:hypothetical protein [Candidatus Sulfotelmatobacter sp.]HWI56616.1 hypothetical protein [Bacillota bacterium]
MDDLEYLEECVAKWQDLSAEKLTRQQQAVVDVVTSIGLIEGDGLESFWSQCGDSMDRIIESFRMAGASEIAGWLEETSFCRDIIARTSPGADDWACSPEEKKKLTKVLTRLLAKGADARKGLLKLLPQRKC